MKFLYGTNLIKWNPLYYFAVFLRIRVAALTHKPSLLSNEDNFLSGMEQENKDDLKPELENLESEIKEKQSARCLLREKFLRAVTGVVGKECTLHMYPNTNVDGIFRGNDIEFETLLVERLKTPFAEIPHSKIRSSDVYYIEFKNALGS